LVSPTDGERIGPRKRVELRFQPAEPLQANEWYRAQVDYLDRAGIPINWCAFTKETVFLFPPEVFDDSSPLIRSFLWRVQVVQALAAEPSTCDADYEVLSVPSEVWTFYWY
jgi:hypothetical protein